MNQGKFLDNGGCGFLLRPAAQFAASYLPADPGAPGVAGVQAMDLTLRCTLALALTLTPPAPRVLAARHLMKTRGIASPFVEVEVIGAEYDAAKVKTRVVQDNGFNPVWDETFSLRILNPDLALIR